MRSMGAFLIVQRQFDLNRIKLYAEWTGELSFNKENLAYMLGDMSRKTLP